jgi:hypothetical protein
MYATGILLTVTVYDGGAGFGKRRQDSMYGASSTTSCCRGATFDSGKYSFRERRLLLSSLRSSADSTHVLNRRLSNTKDKNAAGTNGKVKYVHLAILTHTMVFCDEWSGKVSRGGPRLLGSLIWTRQARSRFLARVTREGR